MPRESTYLDELYIILPYQVVHFIDLVSVSVSERKMLRANANLRKLVGSFGLR
jgi:hypothetical protein